MRESLSVALVVALCWGAGACTSKHGSGADGGDAGATVAEGGPRCTSSADCAVGQSCDTTTGVCGTTCSSLQPCHGGCCNNGACAIGTAQDSCGLSGVCFSCIGKTYGDACLTNGTCGCSVAEDCPPNTACNSMTNTCAATDGVDDAGDDGGTAQASTTIYAFGAAASPMQDGAAPKGTLTAVASDGGNTVLYGRTAIGGINGCGIIFSINTDGSGYQVLYRFGGSDGCDPRHDAMILDPNDGKLYGTTEGVNQTIPTPPPPNTYGNFGQIFSFAPGSAIPNPIPAVHTFANPSPTSSPYDGAEQHSSFSIDPTSGALYGLTAQGGADGHGMLYSVKTDGKHFTDLYDFKKSEGDDPHGRTLLVDGVLYGIARSGGASDLGAVFAYTLASAKFIVLHTFNGGTSDGASSDHGYLTPVTIGSKTILFGMTQCGGSGGGKDTCLQTPSDGDGCAQTAGSGDGIIFQIDPTATAGSSQAFNIVYSFQGTEMGDGADPFGSLFDDGTYLYGTTSAGGTYDKGTVFRFVPPSFGGTVTPEILYDFGSSPTDGIHPIDNVIRVGNTLYGMTVYGGTNSPNPDCAAETGNGTIFALPLPTL